MHLRRVLSDYERVVDKLILPNFDWYLFDVPTISVDCVVAKISRFEELQI